MKAVETIYANPTTRNEAEADYARNTTHTAVQIDDSGDTVLNNDELSRIVEHINDNAATFTVTDLAELSEGRETKYAWFRVEGMGSDYVLGIDPLNNQEWNMRQLAAGRTWDNSGVFTS